MILLKGKHDPMKTKHALLSLMALCLIPSALFAEKEKTKIDVKVMELDLKDDPANPTAWKAEIVVKSVKTYSELSAVRAVSYQKKSDRRVALHEARTSATSDIRRRYDREEYEALQKLKADDPAAAFYWLEQRVFFEYTYIMRPVPPDEPSSKAYLQFKVTLRDIDKRQKPELKIIDDAYDSAVKKAEEICDAEIEKAEELFEDSKNKP